MTTKKEMTENEFLNDYLENEENFTYEEIEDHYSEFLDEIYNPVELAGMTIYASEMRNIDPVMFRCGVSDYVSEYYIEHNNSYYFTEVYEAATEAYDEYLDEIEENEENE